MAEPRVERWLRPRYVFPLLAVLLLAAVLLTPGGETGANATRLTTYGSGPFAARGVYELLARLGWRVERRQREFRAPLDGAAIYAVLAPPMELSATEVSTLLDAVRRGARAIVIPSAGSPLADSLGVRQSGSGVSDYSVAAASPRPAASRGGTDATRAVQAAATRVGSFDRFLRPVPRSEDDTAPAFPAAARPLVHVWSRDTVQPAIMALPVGRGQVLAVADPGFLRNDAVRDGDAAVLAVRLVEWLDPDHRGRVVFDEYHQGFGEHDALLSTIGEALVSTAPGRGLLHLVAAGLLLLLAYGVRPIAPTPRRVFERRSPLEHVGALSRAYEQIDATPLATQRLVRGLRRRYPLGATGALDDASYLALLRARRPELSDDVEVLRTALARPLPAAEWVAVGAAIDHIERTITT